MSDPDLTLGALNLKIFSPVGGRVIGKGGRQEIGWFSYISGV